MRAAPLLALGGVAWVSPALAPVCAPVADALGVARLTERDDEVGLSFDDGPHPGGTAAVLAKLADAGATATFFVVAEQVEREPGLTREIIAAGHRIGVHGFRHRNQLRLTPRTFAADLDHAMDTIAEATGEPPRSYRPPYGTFSAAGLAIVHARGLDPWLWSKWGHDWRAYATSEGIADELTAGLRGGDVLLLHDADHYNAPGSWRKTAAALPLVLERIGLAGLNARALGG